MPIYVLDFLFSRGPSWKPPLGDWRPPRKILVYYYLLYDKESESSIAKKRSREYGLHPYSILDFLSTVRVIYALRRNS